MGFKQLANMKMKIAMFNGILFQYHSKKLPSLQIIEDVKKTTYFGYQR